MTFLSKSVEQSRGERMIHYQCDPFPLKLAHSLMKNASGGLASECCVLTFNLLECKGNRCTKAGLNRVHQGNKKPSLIFTVLWIRGKISQGTVLIKIQQHSLMCLSAGISWCNYKDPKDRIRHSRNQEGYQWSPVGIWADSGTQPIYV